MGQTPCSADFERRFKRRVVTAAIFPQNSRGQPVYNPQGRLGNIPWAAGWPSRAVALQPGLSAGFYLDCGVGGGAGKYLLRLHFNGAWRKVVVDDRLPVDAGTHRLLCSYSSNPNEFWVSLLEKAYMKVGNEGIVGERGAFSPPVPSCDGPWLAAAGHGKRVRFSWQQQQRGPACHERVDPRPSPVGCVWLRARAPATLAPAVMCPPPPPLSLSLQKCNNDEWQQLYVALHQGQVLITAATVFLATHAHTHTRTHAH
jgi:hypothetical protein